MIGDKILINDYHRAAHKLVLEYFDRENAPLPCTISVAGESGSGKSEIAECLKLGFEEKGLSALVLGQDDYFHLPPHSNHQQRMKDISWVGPSEVRLWLMNRHVQMLLNSNGYIVKPLVFFEDDCIRTEKMKGPFDIIIAEGTYTSLLEDIDIRVFIDRDYHDTKKDRLSRNRDQALEKDGDEELSFLKEVLEIEHKIIKAHKVNANVIIPRPEDLLESYAN